MKAFRFLVKKIFVSNIENVVKDFHLEILLGTKMNFKVNTVVKITIYVIKIKVFDYQIPNTITNLNIKKDINKDI